MGIYSDGNGLIGPCRNSSHCSFYLHCPPPTPPRLRIMPRSRCALPLSTVASPEPSQGVRDSAGGNQGAELGLCVETQEPRGGAQEEGETQDQLLRCASPGQLLLLSLLGLSEPPINCATAHGVSPLQTLPRPSSSPELGEAGEAAL